MTTFSWTTLVHKYFKYINAFLIIGLMAACQNTEHIETLSGQTMGTTYAIKYIDKSGGLNSQDVHQHIEKILLDVNQEMSTFIDTSDLSRFNQLKKINKPMAIPTDLAYVIKQAIHIYELTEGCFDITVGPVVNLWGFGPETRQSHPTPVEISQRNAWVGLDKLIFQEHHGVTTIAKRVPELYLDLSGIAKGYGIDKVADYLESINVDAYLVEIGGDLRAKGTKYNNAPWSIAIEKPNYQGQQEIQELIYLKDMAMATSGNYRNFETDHGKRYSHSIDPMTLLPATSDIASISVLMPTATEADGLATGLMVMGSEKALALAEKHQWPIHLIIHTDNGFKTQQSSGFTRLTQ